MTRYIFILAFLCASFTTFAQTYPKTAINFDIGFNLPQSTFTDTYSAKPVNFPTMNLGFQYLFTKSIGARIDYGFNRFSNDESSPEFKTNYSRVDLQGVYNVSPLLRKANVHPRLGMYVHGGVGMSFLKPISKTYSGNKDSFLNGMAGTAFHYGINEFISGYMDVSYIYALGQTYGLEGALLAEKTNGGLLTLTFGIQIALNTGCYFCDVPE